MLSRAPHAAQEMPHEEAGEVAGLPDWANRITHPVLAEVVPREEYAEQEANEAEEAQEEGLEAESDSTEKGEDEKQLAAKPSEKEHLFDDISISSGEPEPEPVEPAATGELTLAAIFAPHLPWTRRALLLTASIAVNVGLPFINGVFLGFGEIFARAFIAPWIGLAPPLLNYNRYSPSPADVPPLSSIPPGGLRSWAKGLAEREEEDE